jgi:hypothetical protein
MAGPKKARPLAPVMSKSLLKACFPLQAGPVACIHTFMPARGLPVSASTIRTDLGGTIRMKKAAYRATAKKPRTRGGTTIHFSQRLLLSPLEPCLPLDMRSLHTCDSEASRLPVRDFFIVPVCNIAAMLVERAASRENSRTIAQVTKRAAFAAPLQVKTRTRASALHELRSLAPPSQILFLLRRQPIRGLHS